MNMQKHTGTGITMGLAVAVMAASAVADDLPWISSDKLTAQDLMSGEIVFGQGVNLKDFGKQTYDSGIGNDTVSSGPIVGSLSGSAIMDDFTKKSNDSAGGTLSLFQFMGGAVQDGVLGVRFWDDNMNLVSGFQLVLPVTGEYIWSFDVRELGIDKPDSGFVQIDYQGKGEFTWLWTDALNIGFNDWDPGNQDGSTNNTLYAFSMWNLPAPGAIALFGLAGLVGTRRRRA